MADAGIVLNEKRDIIFKDEGIANTFNEHFGTIIEWLDLHMWTKGSSKVLHTQVVMV